MPKLMWALTSNLVITDRPTNSVTYVVAVEGFGLPRFPHPFPPIHVATVWKRDRTDDQVRMRVRVLGPTDEVLFKNEAEPKAFGEYVRYRYNVLIGGFEVPVPGEYGVVVDSWVDGEWKEAWRIPLDIALAEPTAEKAKGVT